MSKQHFQVLLEWDAESDVWVTYVPTLNGLSTFGETREEALTHTREAILGYMEAADKEHLPVPLPVEAIDLEVEVPVL
jgi:predicted RNase H-like HicB family nuclease